MNIDFNKCNWFDPKRPNLGVMTSLAAKRGHPLWPNFYLEKRGLIPVVYDIPVYDKRLYKHEPVGKLNDINVMTKNEDGVLIQKFKVVELPLEDAKRNCTQNLAEAREEIENAGCDIVGIDGITEYKTDRESIIYLTGLVTSNKDIDYKLKDNTFVHLTHKQLESILSQVNAHVQACYTKEKELRDKINNAQSIDELSKISLTFYPIGF